MLIIEYAFSLDQMVITPFGEIGLVAMLGYDDGGKQYYVKTKENDTWYKESQLKKSEGDD